MVVKSLDKVIKEAYEKGLIDENFVMEAVEKTLGGTCKKGSSYDDIKRHIDFWWDSPKGGKIGVDVKGIKKNCRSDNDLDDKIHWIEVQNVKGYPGWIYGEAEYIAFRTYSKIIFVKRSKLVTFSDKCLKGKQIVYDTPKECYVPYKRKKWGRDDLSFKVMTTDLEELADFCIDCD